jgi:hypothetical protein
MADIPTPSWQPVKIMGEADVVTRRSGRPVRFDGFSDAGSCCQPMTNINAPVFFLREIKVAVGGDNRQRSYFLSCPPRVGK